jgi:hypothetical protein
VLYPGGAEVVRRMASHNPRGPYDQAKIQAKGCSSINCPKVCEDRFAQATDSIIQASCGKCSVRQVNMTISLAFLAPNLVKAAVEGRLSRGIGVERLRDPPTEWSRQFEALGLNPE